ncbi:hypothetical protein OAL59_01895 [Nitrosopumilus sp.]|nr:hypothetical protein [Nitrosopumilus sp.]
MSNNSWTTSRKEIIKQFQDLNAHGVSITVDGTTDAKWKTYPVGVFSDTDVKDLPVYTIPITQLRLNYNNGRITDQLEDYKYELEQTGEELDYENLKHQDKIRNILLTAESYSNVSSGDLKSELINIGQNDPAIISNTGIIWNGNRRIANRYHLEIDEQDAKYGFVEVVVLPEMNIKQLEDLETRLQRKEDFKQNYSAVTECLNIRKRLLDTEYIKDWQNPTNEDKNYMKNAFPKVKGNWKGIIKEKELIDLIDDFLNNVLDKPRKYNLIQNKENAGGLTYFQNILNVLTALREPGSGVSEVDIEARKWALLTTALKPKKSHGKIRSINKCFQKNPTLTNEYLLNDQVYQKVKTTGDVSFIKKMDESQIEKSYKNLETVADAYDSVADDPGMEFEKFKDFLLALDTNKITSNLEDEDFIETLNDITEKISNLINK